MQTAAGNQEENKYTARTEISDVYLSVQQCDCVRS